MNLLLTGSGSEDLKLQNDLSTVSELLKRLNGPKLHCTPYLIREENTISFGGICIGKNPGIALKAQFTLTGDIESYRLEKELS